MIERSGTWGEVTNGTTLLSPTSLPMIVTRTEVSPRSGKLWYQVEDHNRRVMTIKPKPADLPVTILEVTPEEAELMVKGGLGAHRILDMEREARMPERAKQWEVPPFPTKGKGALNKAKDHLSWYHATYTTDIRTLKQAIEAHAEMHDPNAIGGLFMDRPHTHREP